MVFEVKNREDLEAIEGVGRCVICGDIGTGSFAGYISCSPEHSERIKEYISGED